jgi:hypothetical protein
MKLPHGDRAIVDIQKLSGYCLNPDHHRGKNKARVFASIGFRLADAAELREAILRAAVSEEAQPGPSSEYGQRFVLDFDMSRFARAIRIRTTWIIREGEEVPRLTSCYVL